MAKVITAVNTQEAATGLISGFAEAREGRLIFPKIYSLLILSQGISFTRFRIKSRFLL